jgi:hypothetical protein
MSETTPPESSTREKHKVKLELLETPDLERFEDRQVATIDMTESTKPCEVEEANKLLSIQNYNV